MAPESTAGSPVPDTLLEDQLLTYARELQTLYAEAKKKQEALAEEQLVLEYRIRELNALNSLFQQYLKERDRVYDALREVQERAARLLKLPLPSEARREIAEILDLVEGVTKAST